MSMNFIIFALLAVIVYKLAIDKKKLNLEDEGGENEENEVSCENVFLYLSKLEKSENYNEKLLNDEEMQMVNGAGVCLLMNTDTNGNTVDGSSNNEDEEIQGNLNLTRAFNYFLRAAKDGYVISQRNLGLCYMNGDGVAQNLTAAKHWFSLAIQQNNAASQFKLGKILLFEKKSDEEVEEGNQLILSAATNGDADAAYYLALDTTFDIKDRCDWFEKAALKNHELAALQAYNCYITGVGKPKNETMATNYLIVAARQGNAEALFLLAGIYFNGNEIIKPDNGTAALLLREAALLGHPRATFNLGLCYEQGKGVEKNISVAVSLFRQAASQNVTEAYFTLGVLYYNGDGVEQDDEVACELFAVAAERGHPGGIFNLNVCKENEAAANSGAEDADYDDDGGDEEEEIHTIRLHSVDDDDEF